MSRLPDMWVRMMLAGRGPLSLLPTLSGLSLTLGLLIVASGASARPHHHPRHPVRAGIPRAVFLKKSNQLHAALTAKAVQIRTQRSQLQSLLQKGVKLTEQIHQDEIAEQDASMRLAEGQMRLQELDVSLSNTLKRLDIARKRLVIDRANLKRRLRDVYEQGNVGVVQVFLNARNIVDFMNRQEYIHRTVHRDLGIVRQVHLDEVEIAAESRALALARAQKALQVQTIGQQAQRLSQALSHRSSLLQATQMQMEAAQQSMSEMESESTNIAGMLQRLQRIPILTINGPMGRRVQYRLHWVGQFLMPVNGPVTSPFGYRYHPILHVYKLHTGVDLGVPWGTPVHAAAAGVVVHASWLGGYGNGIIIDHGDGLATLYGHLSQINVVVGQAIAQGQMIGAVGSTGLSTGPHLHFEARKYGTPVPPF